MINTTLVALKKTTIGLVISLLVIFYPAAGLAAAEDAPAADTTTPTSQTGPTSPPGPSGSSYQYNPDTGNWENDYYIWNPNTQQTTPKNQPTYTYNPDTQTYDTEKWQFNAASGKYEPVVVQTTVNSQTDLDNNTTQGLNNTITSDAQTGDATVSGNTTGGSATTGNASAVVNVINLLQSSFANGGNDGGVVTFMANIPGSVTGNLMVDPASIAQNQAGSTSLQSAQGVNVNNQNDGQINNALVLNASSGDAGVVANTKAGDATSGNADAVANVVNVMNTSVGAGQSFIGVINVQGDLTGDILFPTGFFDSVLANNAPSSDNSATNTAESTATIDNNVNQAINNTVATTATTGNATVDHNTSAGNGLSGKALGEITVLNLTGSDIIGENALLVFVNVGGNWQGLIMNAPGSTAAVVGGNITQDKTVSQELVAKNNVNQGINNDISVNAHSGDATVSGNTQAGNATTGNATAKVNLANILNSHIALGGWFGILFINVGGNWNGSFGSAPAFVNTGGMGGGAAADAAAPGKQPFAFTATANPVVNGAVAKAAGPFFGSGSSSNTGNTDPVNEVLGSATKAATPAAEVFTKASNAAARHYNYVFPVIGLLLGAMILGTDRLFAFFRRG